jgi:hypothetical protein
VRLLSTAGSAGLHEHPYTHAYGYQLTFERIAQHKHHGIDLLMHWSNPDAPTELADSNSRKMLAEFFPGSHIQQNTLGLESALDPGLRDGHLADAQPSQSKVLAVQPSAMDSRHWSERSMESYTRHLMELKSKSRRPIEDFIGVLPSRALCESSAHLLDSETPAQLLPPAPEDPLQFMHAVPVSRKQGGRK